MTPNRARPLCAPGRRCPCPRTALRAAPGPARSPMRARIRCRCAAPRRRTRWSVAAGSRTATRNTEARARRTAARVGADLAEHLARLPRIRDGEAQAQPAQQVGSLPRDALQRLLDEQFFDPRLGDSRMPEHEHDLREARVTNPSLEIALVGTAVRARSDPVRIEEVTGAAARAGTVKPSVIKAAAAASVRLRTCCPCGRRCRSRPSDGNRVKTGISRSPRG